MLELILLIGRPRRTSSARDDWWSNNSTITVFCDLQQPQRIHMLTPRLHRIDGWGHECLTRQYIPRVARQCGGNYIFRQWCSGSVKIVSNTRVCVCVCETANVKWRWRRRGVQLCRPSVARSGVEISEPRERHFSRFGTSVSRILLWLCCELFTI